MSAPVTELELHAYVDEQLNAERRAEVDAYLKEHAAAAARVADYQSQNAALHALFDPLLGEPLPERLMRPKYAPRFSLARVAAAVAWLAVGTLLGLGAMEWRDHRSFEAAVLKPAMVAYATYIVDKNHAVEV